MFHRASLKQEVKNIIQGKRVKIFFVDFLIALLIALAVFVTQAVGGALSAGGGNGSIFMSLLSLLITSLLINPLTLGLYRYYQRVWRQADQGMSDVFDIYRNFGAAVSSMIWKSFWISLWGILLIFTFVLISGMVVGVMSIGHMMDLPAEILNDSSRLLEFMMNDLQFTQRIALATTIAYVSAFILLMIKSISYSQMEFVVVEHPELGAMRSLNVSKRMMKGHKWEYFKLMFSFLPWMLLQAIVVIPGIFCLLLYIDQMNLLSNLFFLQDIITTLPRMTFGTVLLFNGFGFIAYIALSIYIAPYISITLAGYYDRLKERMLDSRRMSAMEFGEMNPMQQQVWSDVDDQQNQPPFLPPNL